MSSTLDWIAKHVADRRPYSVRRTLFSVVVGANPWIGLKVQTYRGMVRFTPTIPGAWQEFAFVFFTVLTATLFQRAFMWIFSEHHWALEKDLEIVCRELGLRPLR